MRKLIILCIGFAVFACKEKIKVVEVHEQLIQEEVKQEEVKKTHWWELPQLKVENQFKLEIMEMRTEENQNIIKKLWDGYWRMENKDETEVYLDMNEIEMINELKYKALKSQGFVFPTEEIFASRIKELFDVDIYADHSLNPRIVEIGDFLILRTKAYLPKHHKKVPTIDFAPDAFIFDKKKRFYTKIVKPYEFSESFEDDYGEPYYVYYFSLFDLVYNNYFFYNSQAAFNNRKKGIMYNLGIDVGYEGFPSEYDDYYKELQKGKLESFKRQNERFYWDYRMYDRSFFARDFNGNLKPRIKMLETMVELAGEDSEYASVVYDYYFRQIKGVYTPDEYAADLNEEIDPYKNLEPYYTKEERAKIWAYLAYYEVELLDKYQSNLNPWPPSGYFEASQSICGYFYQIAKENDFYGLDFSKVKFGFETVRGEDWEEIITSWEIQEPEEV